MIASHADQPKFISKQQLNLVFRQLHREFAQRVHFLADGILPLVCSKPDSPEVNQLLHKIDGLQADLISKSRFMIPELCRQAIDLLNSMKADAAKCQTIDKWELTEIFLEYIFGYDSSGTNVLGKQNSTKSDAGSQANADPEENIDNVARSKSVDQEDITKSKNLIQSILDHLQNIGEILICHIQQESNHQDTSAVEDIDLVVIDRCRPILLEQNIVWFSVSEQNLQR